MPSHWNGINVAIPGLWVSLQRDKVYGTLHACMYVLTWRIRPGLSRAFLGAVSHPMGVGCRADRLRYQLSDVAV